MKAFLMRSRRRRTVVALVVVVAVGVGSGIPALGHHGHDSMFPSLNYRNGASDCREGNIDVGFVCRGDNSTHTVFFRSTVPSNMVTGTRNSLDNSYHVGTDLSIVYHTDATVSYSGGSETDVIYGGTSQNLPETDYGSIFCDDPVENFWGSATTRCDQFYVIYNRNVTPSLTASQARSLACHETGHTVGLLHGSNATPRLPGGDGDSSLACMVTNVDTWPAYLKEHNTYEINRTY